MEKPIPSLSLAHPKPAAERFLTEMLKMGKWDHLFRYMGIAYPIMPKDFYFLPQETIMTQGKQAKGDETLVIFFEKSPEGNVSTIIVGMKKAQHGDLTIWVPNSVFIDLYIKSERIRNTWGADRCAIPTMIIH